MTFFLHRSPGPAVHAFVVFALVAGGCSARLNNPEEFAQTAATNLTWQGSLVTRAGEVTAVWKKAASPGLTGQRIQFYPAADCAGAASAAADLQADLVESYSFAPPLDQTTYTYNILSTLKNGEQALSECSAPLRIDRQGPEAAAGLSWVEASPSIRASVTARWVRSSSPDRHSQLIQFFTDDACAVPAGDPQALGSPELQNQSFSGMDGNAYRFKIITYDVAGNGAPSPCSPALSIDTTPPPPAAVAPGFTWISGTKEGEVPREYGLKGVTEESNFPGHRDSAASWTDGSGNLWLFGGLTSSGEMNDLWMYSPSLRRWTWVGGSEVSAQGAVHGTLGQGSASNIPGARAVAASWVDAAGDFWLFGGSGSDASQDWGFLNDLWKFSPTTRQWTWMSGAKTADSLPTFGELGVEAAANVPGSRENPHGWIDNEGNYWIFGGWGYDVVGDEDYLNDLWKYTPSTGRWTWKGGAQTVGARGTRGTLGIPSTGNVPSARGAAMIWKDPSGTIWLLGGSGYDDSGAEGELNDLWKFAPASGEWTWVAGSGTRNQPGTYGSQGQSSSSTTPGGRSGSVAWSDRAGNLWLFGGYGYDQNGIQGYLNDLWKYSPATGQWIWVDGPNTVNDLGSFGAQQVPHSSNRPSARGRGWCTAASWTDMEENLWLFGGCGLNAAGQTSLSLGDLWAYSRAPGAKVAVAGPGTLQAGASALYSAFGGSAPYSFSIFSGDGTVNSSSGAFSAPVTSGSTILEVTDALGAKAYATIATYREPLALRTSTTSLLAGRTVPFTATGGSLPYSYSVYSGSGGIDPSGLYTAPESPGSATIQVSDATGQVARVSVNVATYQFAAVAVGRSHSCALLTTGDVECWGKGSWGQLGDGRETSVSPVPRKVRTSGAVLAIDAGAWHSCVLLVNGGVECWGSPYGLVPQQMPDIDSAVAVAVGSDHSCAILADASMRCWGQNGKGQLGNGSTVSSYHPMTVVGIDTALAMALGESHSCAVLLDGTVRCWGWNSAGQLGDGTKTDSLVPVVVSGIGTAVAVAVGSWHSCALLSDGTVKCWGARSSGQLGNGTGVESTTPVLVPGVASAIAIAAGNSSTCALISGGSVQCWGDGDKGEIGNGLYIDATSPAAVSGLNSATTIAGGSQNMCAITDDRSAVYCWGAGGEGQLGFPITNSSAPSTVVGLSDVTDLALGSNYACARLNNGTVKCWGAGAFGQLGSGSLASSTTPTLVQGIGSALGLAAGLRHSCAVLTDSTVRCWGDGLSGKLGNGSHSSSMTPLTVSGINNAVEVSCGWNGTCAALADGSVQCWGGGSMGEIGNGNFFGTMTPASVNGITTASQMSQGYSHVCVVLSSGSLRCWGGNFYGQLGDGTTTGVNSPVNVSTLGTATKVSAGTNHTCARLADGSLWCWGQNYYGQLGMGDTDHRKTPTLVSGISDVVDVAGGASHSCALLSDGTVRCWGTGMSYPKAPTPVQGITTGVAIRAGTDFSCALLADSTVKCWGVNDEGQLGTGQSNNRSVPVRVNFR